MCMNCLTRVDALALQGAALALAAQGAWVRASDRLAGRPRAARRLAVRLQQEEFLRSLALDPAAVLGPPEPEASPAVAKDLEGDSARITCSAGAQA